MPLANATATATATCQCGARGGGGAGGPARRFPTPFIENQSGLCSINMHIYLTYVNME